MCGYRSSKEIRIYKDTISSKLRVCYITILGRIPILERNPGLQAVPHIYQLGMTVTLYVQKKGRVQNFQSI